MCLPATIVPRWHERELLNPVFQIVPHAIFLVDAWAHPGDLHAFSRRRIRLVLTRFNV